MVVWRKPIKSTESFIWYNVATSADQGNALTSVEVRAIVPKDKPKLELGIFSPKGAKVVKG